MEVNMENNKTDIHGKNCNVCFETYRKRMLTTDILIYVWCI